MNNKCNLIKAVTTSVIALFLAVTGSLTLVMPTYANMGAFSLTGNMNYVRGGHTATLLSNGKVLIAGGTGDVSSAELYNTSTGTFSLTGSLSVPRFSGNTATLLPNGKVLITGGIAYSHTTKVSEIYDPNTGTFSLTGDMIHARTDHTATLLPNGKVLIVGGSEDGVG